MLAEMFAQKLLMMVAKVGSEIKASCKTYYHIRKSQIEIILLNDERVRYK